MRLHGLNCKHQSEVRGGHLRRNAIIGKRRLQQLLWTWYKQ